MSNNDAQQNNYEQAAIKAGQTMASYLEATQILLKESVLPAQEVAEKAVIRLSETYNQISNLYTSYSKKADLYGLTGNRTWQDVLDKNPLNYARWVIG